MPRVFSLIRKRVEHPDRLRDFTNVVTGIDSEPARRREHLDALFPAMCKLCQAEIDYYYGRRVASGGWSLIFRLVAVAAGTIGIVAPLIPPGAEFLGGLRPWGYPSIALAGGAITANQVFGSTENHRRYVSAQIQLEFFLTRYQLAWVDLLGVMEDISDEKWRAAIALNDTLLADMHSTLREETHAWGELISKQLEELRSRLKPTPEQQ